MTKEKSPGRRKPGGFESISTNPIKYQSAVAVRVTHASYVAWTRFWLVGHTTSKDATVKGTFWMPLL